jgi:NAD(P)-dependent dehydrogenase (short-subunit alcohol dehydrogenase family)
MTGKPETVALVTGASRGLGYAVARALGTSGVQVAALARTVGGLEDLADEIEAAGGPAPTLVPLSVTDEGGLQRLCLAVHERWGRIDLVIHCAAHAAPLSPVEHISDRDFDQCFEVNLRATQRLIGLLSPLLAAAEDAKFVHVTDDCGGNANYGSYGASKAAADALVRSWIAETTCIGPTVSLFQPRPMPTALRARFFPGEDRSALAPCADEATRLLASLKD